MSLLQRTHIRLQADPRQVILRFLDFGRRERFQPVIDHVLALDDEAASRLEGEIRLAFESRHFDLDGSIRDNAARLRPYLPDEAPGNRRWLAGAYFTHEYSIQSAALFNPSIVPHPDQSGLPPGSLRFLLSLRATGEGHISSVVFRTGTLHADGSVGLDPESTRLSCGRSDPDLRMPRETFLRLAAPYVSAETRWSELLTAEFTLRELLLQLDHLQTTLDMDLSTVRDAAVIVFEENYALCFDADTPIAGQVIFPRSRAESNGIEDVRLTVFDDGDSRRYIGTYTAYNGRAIRPQMFETTDFKRFQVRALSGAAVSDKGLALFPEKVGGRYVMAGRQGGRNISVMFSYDLYHWDQYAPLQTPAHDWDMVQLGNCGSPIRTPEGWLLLTHAVGPMRRYVLGLTLLDLQHPDRVIASLDKPLLEPNADEREGYVPNVLYTCGMLRHGDRILVPYAMSDSAIGMATGSITQMLAALRTSHPPITRDQ